MPLDSSLFISADLHEDEVELADGKKYKFWFKELSAVAFRAFQLAEHSPDNDERVLSMVRLIAMSLVEPDGKPAMDLERAKDLKPEVMNKLVNSILKINNIGGRSKNP